MSEPTPYSIGVAVLEEFWTDEAYADDIVTWIFTALDEHGDTTVPRDGEAFARAKSMANMVFADLGDEQEYGAMVSNVLRAAGKVPRVS